MIFLHRNINRAAIPKFYASSCVISSYLGNCAEDPRDTAGRICDQTQYQRRGEVVFDRPTSHLVAAPV